MAASTPSHVPWASDCLSLARRYSKRVAVIDREGSTIYADLFARATGIGNAVLAASAKACEPVGTLLPNGRAAVAASYGVTVSGAAEARLNAALGASRAGALLVLPFSHGAALMSWTPYRATRVLEKQALEDGPRPRLIATT